MAPVSPTVPGDENVGQPASGDPSAPSLPYDGRPNFSTGAEDLGSKLAAQEVVTASNGGDGDLDHDGDPDATDDVASGLVNPADNVDGEPHSQEDAGQEQELVEQQGPYQPPAGGEQ
jgi:hypothetical protein